MVIAQDVIVFQLVVSIRKNHFETIQNIFIFCSRRSRVRGHLRLKLCYFPSAEEERESSTLSFQIGCLSMLLIAQPHTSPSLK